MIEKNKTVLKVAIVLLFVLLAYIIHRRSGMGVLTLDRIKFYSSDWILFYETHKIQTAIFYCAAQIITAIFIVPLAPALLGLAGGAIFGFWKGLLLASFSSSIGATLALLLTRFIFRDSVEARFGRYLKKVDAGIKKEGSFYLFSLRLVPLFPFFLVNLLMGLTAMRASTFYLVSQLGMLPGTAAYVNAGLQLSQMESLKEVASFDVVASFALLGVLPIVSKKVLAFYRR